MLLSRADWGMKTRSGETEMFEGTCGLCRRLRRSIVCLEQFFAQGVQPLPFAPCIIYWKRRKQRGGASKMKISTPPVCLGVVLVIMFMTRAVFLRAVMVGGLLRRFLEGCRSSLGG